MFIVMVGRAGGSAMSHCDGGGERGVRIVQCDGRG